MDVCVKGGVFQVIIASFPQTNWGIWKVSMFPLIINFTFLSGSLFYRGEKKKQGEDIPSEFAGNNLFN